jgi:hypothetical protein
LLRKTYASSGSWAIARLFRVFPVQVANLFFCMLQFALHHERNELRSRRSVEACKLRRNEFLALAICNARSARAAKNAENTA